MTIKHRITFILAVVMGLGLLTGFSHADGTNQTNATEPAVSTEYAKSNIQSLKSMVESYSDSGKITNPEATRHMLLHLTVIEYYVDQGMWDKAIHQMEQFESLVKQHGKIGNMHGLYSSILQNSTKFMKWQWEGVVPTKP